MHRFNAYYSTQLQPRDSMAPITRVCRMDGSYHSRYAEWMAPITRGMPNGWLPSPEVCQMLKVPNSAQLERCLFIKYK